MCTGSEIADRILLLLWDGNVLREIVVGEILVPKEVDAKVGVIENEADDGGTLGLIKGLEVAECDLVVVVGSSISPRTSYIT